MPLRFEFVAFIFSCMFTFGYCYCSIDQFFLYVSFQLVNSNECKFDSVVWAYVWCCVKPQHLQFHLSSNYLISVKQSSFQQHKHYNPKTRKDSQMYENTPSKWSICTIWVLRIIFPFECISYTDDLHILLGFKMVCCTTENDTCVPIMRFALLFPHTNQHVHYMSSNSHLVCALIQFAYSFVWYLKIGHKFDTNL